MNARSRLIAGNFLAYQSAWFAGVWSAAVHRPWIGAIIMVAAIGIPLLRAQRREAEFILVTISLGSGLLFDSLLVWQGWVWYPSGNMLPNLPPIGSCSCGDCSRRC